ncbi:hypothetical protein [Filifactor alocis]|jgi:hypothetical protein|uniref:hypothetical protein n=1 Tax=Filifactor alocis TaxID=143361 RepID=UPI0028EDD7C1|nr:hypothetical protein [Filifactor alocis]
MKKLITNTKKICTKRKHKGVLYVYIIILMLVVVMLSGIIATMFDNNLKNAVTQKDNLQLYYYSRAGADWAVNLIQSKEPELSISSGSKISLADKLRADTTYHVKWTGQGELKAKGNEVGRFSVTIEKVKKRVDSAGQFVATGGREVDYAKITSIGKSLSKDSTGNLVEGKEEYFITVLVSLEALDSVIYMPGER